MAKNKTSQTADSVNDFINTIADETQRNDCLNIIKIIKKQTGFEPKLWGKSIVGFGSYHYKYESGREGDMGLFCFSPRTSAIVFYIFNFENKDDLLKKLGKHKTGKGCLYIKKLEDVDIEILKQLIQESIKYIQTKYPDTKGEK